MNLGYLLLPVGIILLLVPTTIICGGKMRTRLDQPARRHNEGIESLIHSWINWIDLVRGAAGAWFVQNAFKDAISSRDELAPVFLGTQLAIVFAGVLAQTYWLRKPARVIGPLFFLIGVTMVVSGPLTGGFALLLGLSCALMIGRLSTAFTIVPIALVGFGILFQEFDVAIAFNAAVFALPVFLSFRFGTRISFVRRTPDIRNRRVTADRHVKEAPPVKTEAAPDLGKVIRPDFARRHEPPMEFPPDPIPERPRKAANDLTRLPDFLRIAEEPEQARRKKTRTRLFARGGA